MFLGALIDLGVDAHQLERELAKLKLTGYHLHADRGQNGNISGVKFDVHLEGNHGHSEHDVGHHHDTPHDHHHHHPEPQGHTHAHSHEQTRTFSDISALIAR